MGISEILEDLKQDWGAIKDAFYDAVWWLKDLRANQERAELKRLGRRHREQSELVPLDAEGVDAEAKRIDAETLLVR